MPYKDEQLVIIAPGSQTTLAQHGIPESIAPAQLRLRSCMFHGETEGEWEPFKVREWPRPATTDGTNGEGKPQEPELYEDVNSEEGAVWPIKEGRIVNWTCFFALLSYVHRRLSPHLHSPMLLVAQPAWTAKDYETITEFVFEKFKPPVFTIVDSALTALWGYSVVNACVIDVGHEKSDVTAITEFSIHNLGRTVALPGTGGDAMTQRLLELLKSKGFTHDMAEQLKQSPIAEILPFDVPLPGKSGHKEETVTNPAAAASTGAIGSGPGQRITPGAQGDAPRGPGPNTEVGDGENTDADEGVLDVASIVAGNQKSMQEFLARKEKEKQEKAAKKKGADAAAAAAKPTRLRNSDKEKTTFTYDPEATVKKFGGSAVHLDDVPSEPKQETEETTNGENGEAAKPKAAKGKLAKREVEVGTERFQAASNGILERLADAVHRAISSIDDASKRGEAWDNLILVGNGARIKGFKEALISTIQRKYIISPSSATIFTSELPSHMTTPTGTGANTPQPQSQLGPHGIPQPGNTGAQQSLLAQTLTQQAAANLGQQAAASGLPTAHSQNFHSSHSQTPTSVKYAKIGDYFPEWKERGFDEAHFLGAQVMAKVLFVVDAGNSKGFMTRTDYNDMGPTGIHEFGP